MKKYNSIYLKLLFLKVYNLKLFTIITFAS